MNDPLFQGNGGNQIRATNVAVGICIATAVVSFIGYLPNFHPYLALIPGSLSFPFPKFWILITGMFYTRTLFSGFMQCAMIIILAQQLEPIWGSKEFLRIFIMSGIFTNIMVIFVSWLVIFITGDDLILIRPFLTMEAPISAIAFCTAHQFYRVVLPTPCGSLKMRYLPAIYILLQVVMSLLSEADGLLCTAFGNLFAYVYLRFIRKRHGIRGDSNLDVTKMLPPCCCCGAPCGDVEDDGNDIDIQQQLGTTEQQDTEPGSNFHPTAIQGGHIQNPNTDHGGSGGFRPTTFNGREHQAQRQNNQNTGFAGRPRTLND